jgi:hypothetical protein
MGPFPVIDSTRAFAKNVFTATMSAFDVGLPIAVQVTDGDRVGLIVRSEKGWPAERHVVAARKSCAAVSAVLTRRLVVDRRVRLCAAGALGDEDTADQRANKSPTSLHHARPTLALAPLQLQIQ